MLCLSIICSDLGITWTKISKKVIDLNVFGEQIDGRIQVSKSPVQSVKGPFIFYGVGGAGGIW